MPSAAIAECAAWAACALLLAATPAAASPGASAFAVTPEKSTWVLVGGNLGTIIGHGDTSWLVGAEASIAHVTDREVLLWYGGYADLVDDANHPGARISAGGEIGVGFLGLDAGVVADLADDRVSIRFRPNLTIGVATLYLGPVIPFAGSVDHDSWTEAGVLVKLPLRL